MASSPIPNGCPSNSATTSPSASAPVTVPAAPSCAASSPIPKPPSPPWANLAIRTPVSLLRKPARLAPRSALLQVSLDLGSGPRRRVASILVELAPGAALAQQIPALVQRLLGGLQLGMLLVGGQLTGGQFCAQLVLGLDELVNIPKDLLVVHVPCRVLDGGFVTISIRVALTLSSHVNRPAQTQSGRRVMRSGGCRARTEPGCVQRPAPAGA